MAYIDNLKDKFKTGAMPSGEDFSELIEASYNGLLEVTYAELKAMRDNGELTPGGYYRIIDYVTTTNGRSATCFKAESNYDINHPVEGMTKSAGHQFDLILNAISENELSMRAQAVPHKGDTYFSQRFIADERTFGPANMTSWQIWYDIDNDYTKYGWIIKDGIDSDGNPIYYSKGVIYRMIDEWNNDLSYDFKNIMFYRDNTLDKYNTGEISEYKGVTSKLCDWMLAKDGWYYTFSFFNSFDNDKLIDNSLGLTIYNNRLTGEKSYPNTSELPMDTVFVYRAPHNNNCWVFNNNISSFNGNTIVSANFRNNTGQFFYNNIVASDFFYNNKFSEFNTSVINGSFFDNNLTTVEKLTVNGGFECNSSLKLNDVTITSLWTYFNELKELEKTTLNCPEAYIAYNNFKDMYDTSIETTEYDISSNFINITNTVNIKCDYFGCNIVNGYLVDSSFDTVGSIDDNVFNNCSNITVKGAGFYSNTLNSCSYIVLGENNTSGADMYKCSLDACNYFTLYCRVWNCTFNAGCTNVAANFGSKRIQGIVFEKFASSTPVILDNEIICDNADDYIKIYTAGSKVFIEMFDGENNNLYYKDKTGTEWTLKK